ncbi:unnamed protein product, partial [marine sediment metagenome]
MVQGFADHVSAKAIQYGGQVSRQFYLLIRHEASSDEEHDIRALDIMLGPEFPTEPRANSGL